MRFKTTGDISGMNFCAQDDQGKITDLLARYAAGQLSLPLHVLVASHLALRESNHRFVDCVESLAAHEMECCQPVALSQRNRCLEAIFANNGAPSSPVPRLAFMPKPLQDFIGADLANIKWKRLLPGLKEYTICEDKSGEANLYLIKAGHRIPSHTHEGNEITLVLKGSFSDQTGTYKTGDIAIADASVDHRPTTGCGEDCLCYSVLDAPLHLTGPIGRIIDKLF